MCSRLITALYSSNKKQLVDAKVRKGSKLRLEGKIQTPFGTRHGNVSEAFYRRNVTSDPRCVFYGLIHAAASARGRRSCQQSERAEREVVELH